MTDQPASLADALAALQADLPHIAKDKTAKVTSQRTGKTHSYDYADLAAVSAAIMPRMAKLGLSFTCRPTWHPEAGFVLSYELLHNSEHKETRNGLYPLPDPRETTPQTTGSAITYARRYCLCAVTGVAPDEDDDDAQAAEAEYRAQRNRPPEVDEHGAATLAEQTRMITGPEPGAWRSTTTAENDRYYDNGKTPEQVHRDRMAQMFALYAKLGIKGNDDDTKQRMLADLSAMLDKPVTSRADLNLAELTTVCAILRRRAEQEEHAA